MIHDSHIAFESYQATLDAWSCRVLLLALLSSAARPLALVLLHLIIVFALISPC